MVLAHRNRQWACIRIRFDRCTVYRPPCVGAFGILELATLRNRKIVHASAGELGGEVDGVFDAIATFDHVVSEHAATDEVVLSDAVSNLPEHLEG